MLLLLDFVESLLATFEESELVLVESCVEEVDGWVEEVDYESLAATEPEALVEALPLSEPDALVEEELGEVLLVLDWFVSLLATFEELMLAEES